MEFSAVTANGQPLDVIMANVTAGVLDMQHKFYIVISIVMVFLD